MALFTKKVSINTIVETILIPDIEEILKETEQNNIWYNDEQIQTYRNESIKEIEEYASLKNIQIIQNGIRAGVYKISKNQYIISPQCVDTIKVIMRSVFLQHSANMNQNITQQISELNSIVINYCVTNIYGEAKGYIKYLHDASTMHIPIDHPTQSGCYNKSLKPNPFV